MPQINIILVRRNKGNGIVTNIYASVSKQYAEHIENSFRILMVFAKGKQANISQFLDHFHGQRNGSFLPFSMPPSCHALLYAEKLGCLLVAHQRIFQSKFLVFKIFPTRKLFLGGVGIDYVLLVNK